MALFIRKENPRSELQERIAAELQEKLRTTDKPIEYEKPENWTENEMHESQNLGPIIAIVCMLIVVGVAYLLVSR